jgi:lactoylglutathione lyase
MFKFNHFNINVLHLERSIAFYRDALGLTPCREIVPEDGAFKIVYLSDGSSDFVLELTWLRDRTEPYNLGDEEFHLAFTAKDYDAAHAKHEVMGCICFENKDMGIYFIQDPDGYWLEVLPPKR